MAWEVCNGLSLLQVYVVKSVLIIFHLHHFIFLQEYLPSVSSIGAFNFQYGV